MAALEASGSLFGYLRRANQPRRILLDPGVGLLCVHSFPWRRNREGDGHSMSKWPGRCRSVFPTRPGIQKRQKAVQNRQRMSRQSDIQAHRWSLRASTYSPGRRTEPALFRRKPARCRRIPFSLLSNVWGGGSILSANATGPKRYAPRAIMSHSFNHAAVHSRSAAS